MSLQNWKDILPDLDHTINNHFFNGGSPINLYLIANDNRDCQKCCEELSMAKELTCKDVGCRCDKKPQYVEWTNQENTWRAAWVPKSYDTSNYELKCEFLSKDMLGNNMWKPCEDPHVSVLILALINSDRETIKIHRENSVDRSGMLLQAEDKCPESPTTGDCYYNPGDDVFKRWDGEQWVIYAPNRWFYMNSVKK